MYRSAFSFIVICSAQIYILSILKNLTSIHHTHRQTRIELIIYMLIIINISFYTYLYNECALCPKITSSIPSNSGIEFINCMDA